MYAVLHVSVFLTTIPTAFQDVYHERVGIAGFHYLALGLGLSIPSQINARLMDKIYKLLKARNGGVGRPEFRLRAQCSCSFVGSNNSFSFVTVANIVPGTILLPLGLLITGWTTQERVFWLLPDIVSNLNCVLFKEVLRYIYRVLHWSVPALL